FVTLALVPWLLIEQGRGRRLAPFLREALIAGALVLVPIVVCYMPFWAGPATFSGPRSQYALDTDPAAAARSAEVMSWLTAHGTPGPLARLAPLVLWQWPALLLYGVLTVWVWQSRRAGVTLAAWVAFAVSMARFRPRVWLFPWYFFRPTAVALCRWEPLLYRRLIALCTLMGYLIMLEYTVRAAVP